MKDGYYWVRVKRVNGKFTHWFLVLVKSNTFIVNGMFELIDFYSFEYRPIRNMHEPMSRKGVRYHEMSASNVDSEPKV